MTRADRMRNMTDEELTQELIEFECLGHAENTLTTFEQRLAYLKEEAED